MNIWLPKGPFTQYERPTQAIEYEVMESVPIEAYPVKDGPGGGSLRISFGRRMVATSVSCWAEMNVKNNHTMIAMDV